MEKKTSRNTSVITTDQTHTFENKDDTNRLLDKLMERLAELEMQNEELQKSKATIEDQLQRHINFYNYAPSGYFTLSNKGIIRELNQSAAEFLGKNADYLKGRMLSEFIDDFSVSTLNRFFADLFSSSEKHATTIALKSHRGVPVNVLIEGISLPSKSECLIDMVDISGRIKILDQLAESEVKYRSLLDNLNEGIAIVDLEETFTYANPAGEVIFGVSSGDLKNRNLVEFLSGDQLSILANQTEKRRNGENSRYELDITTFNGETKTILVSGTPHYNRNGELIGTLGMFTDISIQKNNEREIQRRLKLELIISEISNDFVHLKSEYLDQSVNRALQKIGSFADVDRSYIFLFTEDGLFCNNTHEWCNEGIEPQIENLQEVPLEVMPWWMDKLGKYETIYIPLVSDLPPEAIAEKEILEAQDIKSLLVIPLLSSEGLIGFLGFDSVAQVKKWQNEDILLLNTVGEILGNGFSRMKYEEDLVRINTQLELKVEERTRDITNLLELNRAIIDSVGLMVISTDRDGIIRSFNPFAEKMLGYDASEVIGKYTPLIFNDPAEFQNRAGMDSPEFDQVDSLNLKMVSGWGLKENRYSEGNERTFVSKDGKRINVLLTVSQLEDGKGNTIGFVGVAIDITDRKKAEIAQIKTTQNLMNLIQNLRAGTLFEDETRHIYMVNQSFCNLFGIDAPPEALVGLDCAMASEASKHLMVDPDGFIRRIDEIITERKIAINDELILKDGRVFERDYIPILYNNVLIGHLWQYRDITDRKLNEQYAVIQRDLGFNLAATTSIEQALSQVVRSTFKVGGIQGVGIYLLNASHDALELVSHEGFSSEFIESIKYFGKNDIQFKIVQEGEPVYGCSDDMDLGGLNLFYQDDVKQIGIIPIKHEGNIIGSLNVASRSPEQMKYAVRISLEIICSQIGGTLARINMENALKLSQKNFYLMFETIDDFMFILDVDGRIIKTNPVVERRLGYTQDELCGLSVLQVHPPGRREEAGFIVGEMLAGRMESCPVPLLKKDGTTIPVETKVVFGKWDGKDALYGISRDISERLKAEETLRESEQRWLFALEGSGDGVWDWNILNNEVFFSKQWKAMLGYSVSEIGNQLDEWERRVYPDDLSGCIADLNKHFNGETDVYMNEHRMLCKDGTYKWILDRGKVVEWTEDRKPARIIGTHTDITPRKLLEEQLLKTIEKEKELNDLKSRFVATASHEFRTPLASILMVSETLISYQKKMDEVQVASRLMKVKEHVLHLTKIVNDVLQLSKMQEGKIGYNPVSEDILAICKNLIDGFNSTIFIKGQIEFRSQFTKLIGNVDSRLITQAVSNLLSNAVKYSGDDPRILLEIAMENMEWVIRVQDNGIGIPEADQKHLFKPFFRAGNVSTIQGNGLGLSIVHESVQMHGGKILFESKPFEGSCFILNFPMSLITEFSF
ncbi:MAG: PAS domain S-box protein [Prolixibacteraceae bacterium]|nr:PAS domain S-box protein [Prolixibacteraceae bacterium]